MSKPKSRVKCAVGDCKSNASDNPKLTFHKFPSNNCPSVYVTDYFGNKRKVDQLTAWMHVLKIGRFHRGMRVCSLHFTKNDYRFPDIEYEGKKPLLIKTAVPSCKLPLSDEEILNQIFAQEQRIARRQGVESPSRTRSSQENECPPTRETQTVAAVSRNEELGNVCGSSKVDEFMSTTNNVPVSPVAETLCESGYLSDSNQTNTTIVMNDVHMHEFDFGQEESTITNNEKNLHQCQDGLDNVSNQLLTSVQDECFDSTADDERVRINSASVHIDAETCARFLGMNSTTSPDDLILGADCEMSSQDGNKSSAEVVNSQDDETRNFQKQGVVSSSGERCDFQMQKDYKYSLIDLIKTDEQLSTATGIESFKLLKVIVECVKIATKNKYEGNKFSMKTESRVLMTYVKLKQNLSWSFLALIFNTVTEQHYANIFIETVKDLRAVLEAVAIRWPTREVISRNLPKCFEGFEDTRIVLDCTEVFIQRPKNLCCQIIVHSQYKGGDTIKIMTGVTPGGVIAHISKPYGGRASDSAIFEQSDLLKLLEPGDAVMVDKGFLIDELCQKNKIKLYRPPFLRNAQFTPEEAKLTRTIASARVHVERFNQRIKVFKILGGTMSGSFVPLVGDIFTVICGTINLSSPIISDDNFMTDDD